MTQSVSPSVGSSAASAGRSIPDMVRSASLEIAISAPVLPAESAAQIVQVALPGGAQLTVNRPITFGTDRLVPGCTLGVAWSADHATAFKPE